MPSSVLPDLHRPAPAASRRAMAAGPIVAVVAVLLALAATADAGVPLRDHKHVTITRLVTACGIVAAVALGDILVRAARGRGPVARRVRAAAAERWSGQRAAAIAVTLVAFFVTYFAYRNLKSVVPLLRPDAIFDQQLTELDRDVFGGTAPGQVLHDLLGTGVAAHVLSDVYMLFFFFIPITLALALVLLRDLRAGLFYATALSANWLLAAGSYFVLPSLGPFHADAAIFARLPTTAVSDLQTLLLDERAAFLRDPAASGAAQSIGAFASLHVSIYVTAALATHVLGLPRPVRVAAWTLTALTVLSTIYFGWHYLADDVAGAAIAVLALVLARAMTGLDLRTARGTRRAPVARAEAA